MACGLMLAGVAARGAEAPGIADRWALGPGAAIHWDAARDGRLPHQDFLEQSGRGVSQVVRYEVGADGALAVRRSVVWPRLRTFPNNTHASLTRAYGAEAEPVLRLDGQPAGPIKAAELVLDGTLTIRGRIGPSLAVERVIFPAPESLATLDVWKLRNTGHAALELAVAPLAKLETVRGPYGVYVLEMGHDAPASIHLAPGQAGQFTVTFSGRLASEAPLRLNAVAEEARRRAFVAALNQALVLETPNPVLDRAFAFAKLRAAESVYATRGGLMLGPGGLSYYAALWCNDNVEYAGPFFPFLGDAGGNEASLNTYRLFAHFMGPDYHPIPSSIVAEGVDIWEGAGDRGDAAMYAYGVARFCLARGDRAIAEELWPRLEWSLEYCRRKLTPEGVVASDSDELEGRFPAGRANLSTASLAYGGLRSAADLGRALGKTAAAGEYARRADLLAKAIESYFGARVEGFDTYRYYDTNTVLRSWICLPLCQGLMGRREGTIAALFSPRLWTADGLATQAGDKTFWDRSTLYGFRGVFQAGETATALRYLEAYSRRRLLGDHVPYAVEAFPEGGQRHLAAESALHARVYTEGLFGILPTGLDRFQCLPRLPEAWDHMALRSIRAFGREFDLTVSRAASGVKITVTRGSRAVFKQTAPSGQSVEIVLSH